MQPRVSICYPMNFEIGGRDGQGRDEEGSAPFRIYNLSLHPLAPLGCVYAGAWVCVSSSSRNEIAPKDEWFFFFSSYIWDKRQSHSNTDG